MGANNESSPPSDLARFASTPPAAGLPEWYPILLDSIGNRVSQGQSRAALAANRELIDTYWHIGRDILARQSEQGWGTKVIDRLSADLRERFPGIKGFSPRNLKYMRSFAEAWPLRAIVQQPVAQLPWGHNLILLQKLDIAHDRLWYANTALAEGWSRNHLVRQIETKLLERSGQAISNFQATMSSTTSVTAQEATKDPYLFDFLELTDAGNERGLEDQLMRHIERFLLELGRGFAFVGRQTPLEIAGDEFFPDLLFYNFMLRRFVVVELKATKFEPGHLGQLGMYMSAVDDLLAQPGDEPTIGLLLCKTKNSVVAEYALRGYSSPIGVAEWATELKDSLPEELSGKLPSIDELEAELAQSGIAEDDQPT
ncbi:PDDEXK nuclease domain-containing protein [Glutamicibacter creatinolyticus]|uniref:PDDEXK nuclease domain-containing protein n=1 Tax=Glutamicibacter creatinolyticus TaxID=162496 RepID=UPI0031D9687B